MEATTIRAMTVVDIVEQGVDLMPGTRGRVCCDGGRDFEVDASEEMSAKYLLGYGFPKIRMEHIFRTFFTLDIFENKSH